MTLPLGPLPAELDGLRVPARYAARAIIAARPDGDLFVADWTPPAHDAPVTGAFTAILCDGGVHHYFHYMEALIWLGALQQRYLPQAVLQRIVFAWPWDNPTQNHVQKSVLSALLPGVEIADPGWAWPATLDSVLIIDRAWMQTGINKFLEAAMGFASPYAREMGRKARLAVRAGPQRAPAIGSLRILHVPRPPPRCLTAPAEAALLGLLASYGTLTVADFATIPWEQQVRLVASHDVLVGVHGNGLTNVLWMHPGGLVLELFPKGVRHYDYQLFAELCGLTYFGFERDRVFPAYSRTGAPYGHQNPTNRPVETVPLAALARCLECHFAGRA